MDIRLTYAVTRGDVWTWYWRQWRRRLWMFHAAILASSVTIGFIDGVRGHSSLFAPGIGLLFVLGLIAYPQLRFKPETRVLSLRESGVETTIRDKTQTYAWRDIGRIEDAGEKLVLFTRKMNAFIIPQSAFASTQHRQDVVRQIREWQAAAC